ncbi:MAG: amidase domain-containing protein [Lawsonibacter sp.]|nr:amidase domain-containing protein [Lawsonibacter sp.]MCI8914157.1 amidase domain-containing protein [Lawsonibacter sp.]
MPELMPYDRQAAVWYAHRWAYSRNPRFYDFEEIGGDCTNFASQCLYAGTGVMNYTPTFGWYYINGNDKAPAWTGVPYFFNFMTREEASPGPVGLEANPEMLLPGDFVQLRFTNDRYGHTPIIVEIGDPPTLGNILVAAHSQDADYRPLDTYHYQEIRFIHILGAYPQQGPPQVSPPPEEPKPPFLPPWPIFWPT